ncbi:VOC family protein [Anaerorhabdus sp.]|uniref:VOC family protein n=1 Tax=Anaerorhabdus sp. TaxID=1872524 RepID=UPI002FC6AC2F
MKEMIKKLDHYVITTRNASLCFDFYEKLGFDIKKYVNRGEMFAGDFKINVHFLGKELEPHALNVMHGSADLCFELSIDIEMFKQHLQNQGISIEEGIVPRSGVKGDMVSIYLRDPDGNLLEFSSYEI